MENQLCQSFENRQDAAVFFWQQNAEQCTGELLQNISFFSAALDQADAW